MAIDFEKIRKYPTAYLLNLCLIAIVYMYISEKVFKDKEIRDLKKEIVEYREVIRKVDSLLWDSQTKNLLTKQLRK